MFAVVRTGGKIFISQTPVLMTIRGAAAPPQPPVQPVASDLIGDLRIAAVSPTEVPPGEPVKFKMTYVFSGTQRTNVEAQLAWKVGEGQLTYGKQFEDDVVPGPNTSEGWSFKTAADTAVGTRFTLFAVIKAGGKTFISQAGVPMTVTASAANSQPQPAPAPQPATTRPHRAQPAPRLYRRRRPPKPPPVAGPRLADLPEPGAPTMDYRSAGGPSCSRWIHRVPKGSSGEGTAFIHNRGQPARHTPDGRSIVLKRRRKYRTW
jgi:hypothetical protein